MRAQIPAIPAWPGPNRPETAHAEEVAGILVGLGVRLFKTRKLSGIFPKLRKAFGGKQLRCSWLVRDLRRTAAIAAIAMMQVAMLVHVHIF